MKNLIVTSVLTMLFLASAAGQNISQQEINLLSLKRVAQVKTEVHADDLADKGFWFRETNARFEYGNNGKLSAIHYHYYVDDTVRVFNGHTDFEYNDENLIVQQNTSTISNGQFIINRIDYAYDENQFDTLQTLSLAADTLGAEYKNILQYSFIRNVAGDITEKYVSYFDDATGEWTHTSRETFTYNDNGALVEFAIGIPIGDGTYFPSSRTVYILNDADLPTLIKQEIWNGVLWIGADRTEFEYLNGFKTQKTVSIFSPVGSADPILNAREEYARTTVGTFDVETTTSFEYNIENAGWDSTYFDRTFYDADGDQFYEDEQRWDETIEMFTFVGGSRTLTAFVGPRPVFEPDFQLPDSATHIGDNFNFRVGFASGEAAVLTLTEAPAGMTIDETGVIDWPAAVQGLHTITVHAVNGSGSADLSFDLNIDFSTPNENGEVARAFTLNQNYPNPFNPTTQIQYSLVKSGQASIKVYDMMGRLVKTLVDGIQPAGVYSVSFNAEGLASGTYFYHLSAGGQVLTHKMVLLR